MKCISLDKYFLILLITCTFFTGCKDPITEFGYDATLTGEILNQGGEIVSGDITNNDLTVRALGERDQTALQLRVQGDGTFKNSKLFPQSYQVWLVGPFIESPTQQVTVDLTGNGEVVHDFEITPFIDIATPELNGSPSSSEISVNYSVLGNDEYVPGEIEVYCSTVSYPNTTTGDGPSWHTITFEVSNDSGSEEVEGIATISDLESGTKYYVRVGSRAEEESSWNYSDQISVSTP